MTRFSSALCALLMTSAPLLLVGCNQAGVRADSPEFQPDTTLDQSDPRAKLVLGSSSLVGEVRLSAPRFREVGTLTEAQVSVQNLSGDHYTLEYKFDWEDDQGFTAGNSGSWYRFELGPKQVRRVTSIGKVPEAKNIVFTVRLPDDYFIREKAKQQDNNQSTDNPQY